LTDELSKANDTIKFLSSTLQGGMPSHPDPRINNLNEVNNYNNMALNGNNESQPYANSNNGNPDKRMGSASSAVTEKGRPSVEKKKLITERVIH
jgi:hypothetical protein